MDQNGPAPNCQFLLRQDKLERAVVERRSQKESPRATLPGHWAAQCPPPPPPTSTSRSGSPSNRQKGEAMMAGSRSDLRTATIGRIVGLQDGGASSMVGGHGFMMDMLQAFVEKGVHLPFWRGQPVCGLVHPPARLGQRCSGAHSVLSGVRGNASPDRAPHPQGP